MDGNQYARYGVWFGAQPILHGAYVLLGERHTNNRAEMTAALRVLGGVPNWVPPHRFTVGGGYSPVWDSRVGTHRVENEVRKASGKCGLMERNQGGFGRKDSTNLVDLSHTYREGNEQADELAKAGSNQSPE